MPREFFSELTEAQASKKRKFWQTSLDNWIDQPQHPRARQSARIRDQSPLDPNWLKSYYESMIKPKR